MAKKSTDPFAPNYAHRREAFALNSILALDSIVRRKRLAKQVVHLVETAEGKRALELILDGVDLQPEPRKMSEMERRIRKIRNSNAALQ